MNKLMKRTVAFVLMVCLLTALAVPVMAAPAASSGDYVYDFRMDKTDLTWTYNGRTYTFGQSNMGHSNGAQVKALDAAYANGDLNWNFPHTNQVGQEGDEAYIDGLVANPLTFKNHANDIAQFGGEKYNTAGNFAAWDGIKYQPYSSGDATGGWIAITLKAPAVGTYNVSLEYTQVSGGSHGANFYLIPYTDTLRTQVVSDVATFNAYIDTLTDGEDYKLNGEQVYFQNTSTVKGLTANFNQVAITGEYDEYLFIARTYKASRGVFIDALTFSEPAEQEIQRPHRNYSIAGAISTGSYDLKDTAGIADVEALYDDGAIDWSYLGTTATDAVALQKTYIYGKGYYKNLVGDENDVFGYDAFKLRSPGDGVFDISFETYKPGSGKTQVWTNVYIAEYVEGMDPASVIVEANHIGDHRPLKSVGGASGNVVTEVGQFEFAADKEYILVQQVDMENLSSVGKENAEKDSYMTNNTYMVGFVIEPQVEFVPKAYIGTTPYATYTAAAEAAQPGDVIKMMVDYTGNIDLPAGVAIDLNGNTWTVSEYVATSDNEYVFDSVGTGALKAGNVEFYGDNNGQLALATDGGYSFADYELSVGANDYQAMGSKTRFWFKLDLADADLDKIAAGETGLTIGVELAWGEESLVVTFDNGEGEEAFAAAWAAAYKAGQNVWLYADITGLTGLESDLTVKPVLNSAGSALSNGTITYTVG